MSLNLPNLQPGDLVAGRFRIIEAIGSGGFSVVYRAHQIDMNRFIALKVLKPQASSDEKIVERFRREALYASHLSHPNTITLYDYGNTDGDLCYIAMEYLDGMDLSVVVQTHRPMELKRVWQIMVETCRSLSEAHRLGLVHRDLKPENIFLVQQPDGNEQVKVLDFGVSKAISSFGDAPTTLAPLTQEGTVFGTPLYMAPEQAMAEDISPAVDVYALGHIMFEMISGYAAYEGTTNAMDVMLKQINDPPLALPEPWGATPFSELITLCTQKDPNHRVQNAALLLEHLYSDAFSHWADPALKRRRSVAIPRKAAVEDVITTQLGFEEIKKQFSAELHTLNSIFKDVVAGEVQMVLIKGYPGSGRSNLLRGFVDERVRFKPHATVLHRSFDSESETNGLEYELSMLSGIPLKDKGINEVRRILNLLYGEKSDFAKSDLDSDSSPVGALSELRDSLFSQIGTPFREAAKQKPLIWALENLERLDTLTLAFLERFFREIQRQKIPIMIVATVYPEDLQRRPGVVKYTQSLLQPTLSTHHILVSQEKTEPMPTLVPEEDEEAGFKTIRMENPFGEMSTQRIQIDENQESPFDIILGHLAQLGDEVPTELWKLTSARILDTRYIGTIDTTIQQAEKFGILSTSEDVIVFSQPGYSEMLRDSFERFGGSAQSHLEIASLLEQFYPHPTHERLSFIVRQWELGERPEVAISRLIQAGDAAFQSFDLDSAREFFLQVQQVFARNPNRFTSDYDQAQLWLRLGEVHWALAEYGAAEDALHKALQYAKLNDQTIIGKANKLLGDLHHAQSKDEMAIRFYEKARNGFRQLGQARAFANTTNEMAMCALAQGHHSLAEDLCRQAFELAENLGEQALFARISRNLGLILMRRARFDEAVQYLDTSLHIFETLHRTDDIIQTLDKIGYAAYAAGDFDLSLGYFRHGIKRAEDNLSHNYRSQIGAAQALAAKEAFKEAEALLLDAKEFVDFSGDIVAKTELLLLLGDLYLAQENASYARELYQDVTRISETIGQTQMHVQAQIRVAYTYFFEDDVQHTFNTLSHAMENAKRIENRDQEVQIRGHLIYLQLLLHGFPVRADTFESILKTSVELNLPMSSTLCYLFKADSEGAREMWNSAADYLRYARINAAQIENYPLFLQIIHRTKLIQCENEGEALPDCKTRGFALGGILPPEVGRRRFEKFPKTQ